MPDDAQFSSDEVAAVADYEPIDRLALGSLLLGILSVTALVHPLLWVLPALGAVVAFCALRGMAKQDRRSGRRLALAGLVLSLLFGSCAMTWMLSDELILARTSRKYCDAWLEMLRQGRICEAHQLTLHYGERETEDVPLEKLYGVALLSEDPSAGPVSPLSASGEGTVQSTFAFWRKEPPNDKLSTLGEKMSFRYDRRLGAIHENAANYISRHLYSMSFEEDGRSKTVPVVITVRRWNDDGIARWRIEGTSSQIENL